MKLTIELVPETSWFTNLRSELTKQQWDIVRKAAYKNAGYRCEICGGTGTKWPVECHEIWKYDNENLIQKLVGTIALCPDCHMVKHIGLAQVRGLYSEALKHLMKVNDWDMKTANQYIKDVFDLWETRSSYFWAVDITWIKTLGV